MNLSCSKLLIIDFSSSPRQSPPTTDRTHPYLSRSRYAYSCTRTEILADILYIHAYAHSDTHSPSHKLESDKLEHVWQSWLLGNRHPPALRLGSIPQEAGVWAGTHKMWGGGQPHPMQQTDWKQTMLSNWSLWFTSLLSQQLAYLHNIHIWDPSPEHTHTTLNIHTDTVTRTSAHHISAPQLRTKTSFDK